jgi:hypothetical protein
VLTRVVRHLPGALSPGLAVSVMRVVTPVSPLPFVFVVVDLRGRHRRDSLAVGDILPLVVAVLYPLLVAPIPARALSACPSSLGVEILGRVPLILSTPLIEILARVPQAWLILSNSQIEIPARALSACPSSLGVEILGRVPLILSTPLIELLTRGA